ncbi:hypothetical protein ACFQ1I_30290 [Kitasatospora arboriphila]
MGTGSVASLLLTAVLCLVLALTWLMIRRLQAAQRRAVGEAERARTWAETQAAQLRAELDRREERLAEELRGCAPRRTNSTAAPRNWTPPGPNSPSWRPIGAARWRPPPG